MTRSTFVKFDWNRDRNPKFRHAAPHSHQQNMIS